MCLCLLYRILCMSIRGICCLHAVPSAPQHFHSHFSPIECQKHKSRSPLRHQPTPQCQLPTLAPYLSLLPLRRDKARPSASHDVVPSFHAAPPTPDSLDRFFPPYPVSRSTRTPARTSADRYDARGSDVSVVDFEVMLNGDGSMLTEGMPHFGVDESFLGGEGDYVGRSPAKSMLSKVVSPVKVSMSVSPTFPLECTFTSCCLGSCLC